MIFTYAFLKPIEKENVHSNLTFEWRSPGACAYRIDVRKLTFTYPTDTSETHNALKSHSNHSVFLLPQPLAPQSQGKIGVSVMLVLEVVCEMMCWGLYTFDVRLAGKRSDCKICVLRLHSFTCYQNYFSENYCNS